MPSSPSSPPPASSGQLRFRVPAWVRDAARPHCPLCGERFSLFVRRHHCRLCGDVFCHACSRGSALVPFLHNDSRPVRVCAVCHQVVVHRTHDPRLRLLDPRTQRNVAAALDAFRHVAAASDAYSELPTGSATSERSATSATYSATSDTYSDTYS